MSVANEHTEPDRSTGRRVDRSRISLLWLEGCVPEAWTTDNAVQQEFARWLATEARQPAPRGLRETGCCRTRSLLRSTARPGVPFALFRGNSGIQEQVCDSKGIL